MTKESVLKILKENKNDLKAKFDVQKIGLFGSFARDEANEKSDIDIIIKVNKKDFFKRFYIKEYLEKLFNKKVDVGYLESIRTPIKKIVEKELIYV